VVISAAHATLARIDRVVLRRSLTNRTVDIQVLTGTPGASPTAPALTTNVSGTYEVSLAQILVSPAVTSILNAKITDERTYATPKLGTVMSTSVGHDHDGVDSKTIPYANITGTPTSLTPAAHLASHLPGGADALTTAAPATSTPGDTVVTGVAASFSRSDHKHARADGYATGAGTSTPGDTQSAGASGNVSRGDHRHARSDSYGVPAVVLGTAAAEGNDTTVLRTDATIVAFDATVPSTQAIGDAASVGAAAKAARRDHKHAMPAFGAVTAQTSFGAASGNGSAATVAHSDHTHGTPSSPSGASLGAALGYNTPATADGGKRIYTGTSSPTGMTEGDLWFDG
jgi:hypothetical protein